MALAIKINDDLETPYPVPSVCWGRTNDIEGGTHILCCFAAEALNEYRLDNGNFPIGVQYNGKNSTIVIILAIPASKVKKKEVKDAKTKQQT